jgi:hypothetical protein
VGKVSDFCPNPSAAVRYFNPKKKTERKLSESFSVGGELQPVYSGAELQQMMTNAIDPGPSPDYISLVAEVLELKARCTNYRKECRRLNSQIQYVRAIEAENLVLRALLDREDDERKASDTEPAPAMPEDNPPNQFPGETYAEWDMRTRFGSGGPR